MFEFVALFHDMPVQRLRGSSEGQALQAYPKLSTSALVQDIIPFADFSTLR